MDQKYFSDLTKIDIVEVMSINFKKLDNSNIIECNIICASQYIDYENEDFIRLFNHLEEMRSNFSSNNVSFQYSVNVLNDFIDNIRYNRKEFDDIINATILYVKSESTKSQLTTYKKKRRIRN